MTPSAKLRVVFRGHQALITTVLKILCFTEEQSLSGLVW